MSRSVPWRRAVSDACNWHQSQALDSTIYILRQTGPTGFLLKEEGERKNVKVFMGDPHSCTCPVFKKERDLCKHICWLLLKKFRLSVNDPLSWQLGLVEREINEILRGRVTAERPERHSPTKSSLTNQTVNGMPVVEQREIAEEDVCPICQEELLSKKLPVTYCKFACGNSMHIKCMQVWAEHQQKTSPEGTIKCPMCREDFGPIDLLKTEMRNSGCRANPPPGVRMDRHLGVMCSNCSTAPIEGKCYRCIVCPTYNLCQRCFNFPVHTTHSFQFRQKRNQRWRSAPRTLGSGLPDALVNDLMRREITENDYEMLLQMERNQQEELSTLTEDDLRIIPVEMVREGGPLLSLGVQCRICLRGFTVGQTVRKLPCKHRFHQDCIDSWLLHSHPTCPIDGLAVIVRLHQNTHERYSDQNNHTPTALTAASVDPVAQSSSGLALTAMGIPISASRANGSAHAPGSMSTSASRHARLSAIGSVSQLGVPGLELLGVGVTVGVGGRHDDGSADVNVAAGTNVPGGRLLQQARQRRHRHASRLLGSNQENLSQQTPPLTPGQSRLPGLNVVAMGAGNEPGLDTLTPAALVSFLQSDALLDRFDSEAVQGTGGERRLSLGSSGSVLSDNDISGSLRLSGRNRHPPGAVNRAVPQNIDRQRLRQPTRPRSLDRQAAASTTPASRKELQEIYLGNHPNSQPPVTEGASSQRPPPVPKHRPRVFRSVLQAQTTPSIPQRTPGDGNMHLQGNRLNTPEDV